MPGGGRADERDRQPDGGKVPAGDRAGQDACRQYDCVVANPPYMGSKVLNCMLKQFVNEQYKDAKADLYACFIAANIRLSPNDWLRRHDHHSELDVLVQSLRQFA